jgi:hypothetical protein
MASLHSDQPTVGCGSNKSATHPLIPEHPEPSHRPINYAQIRLPKGIAARIASADLDAGGRSSIQRFMSDPQQSNNDPSPEERKGDSSFLPVVVAFAVALLVILAAVITFVKIRQNKAIPNPHTTHPTSRLVLPQSKPPSQPNPYLCPEVAVA